MLFLVKCDLKLQIRICFFRTTQKNYFLVIKIVYSIALICILIKCNQKHKKLIKYSHVIKKIVINVAYF